MKNGILLVISLLATVAFATRCGGSSAGPDAGNPDVGVLEPSDAAQGPADGGSRCDQSKCAPGNVCVQDKCMLTCARHTECPDESYDCRSVEGTLVCVPNGQPVGEGQFGYRCGGAGAVCADGFRCLGGKGDPQAYCTRQGCASDQDCPGSYYCAERDAVVAPDAGVDASSTVIRLCQKRGFCAPAAGLVDCSAEDAVFNQDSEDRGWCLKACSGLDPYGCGAGNECVSTAAGFQCWPRAKTCQPTQRFCGRCLSSTDCGPGGECYVDQFTKEPFCVTPCSATADCNQGVIPSGRLLGVCGEIWEGYCTPELSGFSQDPNGLTCWFPACSEGFAGCTDFVDATAEGAERQVTGSYQEWDAGYGGDYAPKCLKIKAGQSVTFGGLYSFADLPLTQACGPIYNIGSIESGTGKVVRFNKTGLYGYYEPYLGDQKGTDMAGSILVVP